MTTRRITTLEEYYTQFPYDQEIINRQERERQQNTMHIQKLDPWMQQTFYPSTYSALSEEEARRKLEEIKHKEAELLRKKQLLEANKLKEEQEARQARIEKDRVEANKITIENQIRTSGTETLKEEGKQAKRALKASLNKLEKENSDVIRAQNELEQVNEQLAEVQNQKGMFSRLWEGAKYAAGVFGQTVDQFGKQLQPGLMEEDD